MRGLIVFPYLEVRDPVIVFPFVEHIVVVGTLLLTKALRSPVSQDFLTNVAKTTVGTAAEQYGLILEIITVFCGTYGGAIAQQLAEVAIVQYQYPTVASLTHMQHS